MKFEKTSVPDLDATDLAILDLLQRSCKQPLAEIGKQVGLTASSVVERIKKLEDAGVVRGYVALVDARAVGKDVTAFIGVSISHPRAFESFEKEVERAADVLECPCCPPTPSARASPSTPSRRRSRAAAAARRGRGGTATPRPEDDRNRSSR
jgi:hypothetical protein